MKIWSNINYYFNYLNLTRGDSTIKTFFSSNENYKAIKELAEEGYIEFYRKFCEIVKSYSDLYPLNNREYQYIETIKSNCITNSKSKGNKVYFGWNAEVNGAKNYVNLFKQYNMNVDNQYQIEILKNEIKVMKKNLEQIWPIAEAVITRRFCKKLLELLIKKNINQLNIENYTPEIQALKTYLKSLSLNYIPPKLGISNDINIQSEVEKIITELEKNAQFEFQSKYSRKKNTNTKILYLKDDNNDIRTIKLLFKMKTECNNVIHFNKKIGEQIDINNYICDNFEISTKEDDTQDIFVKEKKSNEPNEINEIIIIDTEKENKDKNISITNVAKFIAYGHPNYSTLKALEKFSKNMSIKILEVQDMINKLGEEFDIFNYDKHKSDMLSIRTLINNNLSKLILKDYEISLSNEEIVAFGEYFNHNPYDIDDIRKNEIKVRNLPINENYVNYFNAKRREMPIKDRLKFNITFEENIFMVNILKNLDYIIPELEKIGEIKEKYDSINRYYKRKLNKLKLKINNIATSIDFIKRDKIFTDISKENFIEALQTNFQTEKIEYFNFEINNFYFYIYLLKKSLYDEKSYKSVAFSEDYI